jgi:hypothetical protein
MRITPPATRCLAPILAMACLALATFAGAQSMPGAYGPTFPAKPAAAPLGLDSVLSAAPLHVLPTAETGAADQLAAMRAWNDAGKRPYKVGFSRKLADLIEVRLSASLAGKSAPAPLAGGYVADARAGWLAWGTSVQIAGAQRLRLHLSAVHLPVGSQLFVATPGGPAKTFGLELLAPAGDLWTPSVAGERLNFEVHVPVAALEASSGFDVREVAETLDFTRPQDDASSALFSQPTTQPLLGPRRSVGAISSAAEPQLMVAKPKDDSCLVDSSCETNANFNNIDSYRHAIASLEFVCSGLSSAADCIAGDEYLCSGSLLNDKASDSTPYLLTANHCIPDQETASTLEAFFDFYTSHCNGTPPNESDEPNVSGATLLSAQAASTSTGGSDHSFLQLPSLPSGRYFLGWNANASALSEGTPLYRLSHPAPEGEPMPQSYTQYTNDPNFSGCTGIALPNFLYEHAVVGSTAGGSSGSPLMLSNGQVVGQLGGGCGTDIDNDCDTAANDDYDGAFAATYPSIEQYLNPSTGPTSPCVPGATTLCLDDNRFQVTVAYKTSQSGGLSGNGNSIPLTPVGITEGGIIWFFSATNPEMLIKVIDACSLNNTFWVFYSAGTNAGFTVTVSDTSTGNQKRYTNPDLTAAPPVQDTSALPCS